MMTSDTHPGDTATPRALFDSAVQFHNGAEMMFGDKQLITSVRLLSLQAIEGYLIAHARHVGRTNAEMRSTRHDLIRLVDIAADSGLALRHRVHQHLAKIMTHREYLVVRYGPESMLRLSQATELQSTLNELRQKVGASLGVPR